MSKQASPLLNSTEQKYLKKKEWILYLVAVFFYTNMTGMINEYRRAYLVDILLLPEDKMSFFNGFTSIAGFVLTFVYAMILDNKKPKNGHKFKSLGIAAAIPCGLVMFLIFYTPSFLKSNPEILLVYLCVVALIQGICFYFGDTVNMVAVVMTPNNKEREKLLSFRGISSAVGNSAPLVIVLVMGLILKKVTGEEDASLNYLISAILCAVIGTTTMLLGMSTVKERIVYNDDNREYVRFREIFTSKHARRVFFDTIIKSFAGFGEVIKNKHARIVLYSEFLKSFRGISTFMQPFIAAAMLGSSSKTLIFALPIGIGTMCGMLVVNMLLKKFPARIIYIFSGIYSVTINLIAFGVGYAKLTNEDMGWLQIIFTICLFLTGLQFGASNLLPTMFQADILDDLELKTKKRLDASLPFVIRVGSTISGTIANIAVPFILYGNNSIIGYQQGLADGTAQSLHTKIMLLFFYTLMHGVMMFLAGVPFFFYKLTGEERERVHNAAVAQRAEFENNSAATQ